MGIRSHFYPRVTEWIMVMPALAVGAALLVQDDIFARPSFLILERWGSQDGWACAVMGCAVFRLVALVVNGSFEQFQYSPHVRLAASFVGGVFWLIYSAGLLYAASFYDGEWTAVATAAPLVLLEMVNAYRSSYDAARKGVACGKS